jgi:hypothetical protein
LQNYLRWLNMPTALPDVLCSDGRLVYMRSQPFRLDGTRLPLEPSPSSPSEEEGQGLPPATQRVDRAHLFSPTGLLDDTWWHRTYWMYGSLFVSGWNGYYTSGKTAPAGRILVFDDAKVYGFGRKPQYYRWTTPIEHHLFAADKMASDVPARPADAAKAGGKKPASPFKVKHHWTKDLPLLARAMVLANGTLFVAGPADIVDEEETFKQIGDPAVQAKLTEQVAAWEGKKGGMLWAVSAASGEKLAEQPLEAPPVFDGMAAAGGRLYLTTCDGRLVSFTGK